MKIYFLQNSEGKFFKSRGLSGSGPRWVDKIDKAKPYLKRGTAVGQITRWYNLFPQYPAPFLIECDVTVSSKIDLSKESLNKRRKKLDEIVERVNQDYDDYLKAPPPLNWHDSTRIQNLEYLKRSINGGIRLIKTKFKEFDIKDIGLRVLGI